MSGAPHDARRSDSSSKPNRPSDQSQRRIESGYADSQGRRPSVSVGRGHGGVQSSHGGPASPRKHPARSVSGTLEVTINLREGDQITISPARRE